MAVAEAEITARAAAQSAEHQKHGAFRAFVAASEVIWAALESTARQVLEIAARQHTFDAQAVNQHLEAVSARKGNYREDAYAVEMRGSVAMVYVEGTIFRNANLFTYYSGGCSVNNMAKDFNTVLDDPTVTDIVLNINSGGGMVDGINEFANMIFAARGKKRIWAYVSGLGCSAAYWIASATDRIICDDTAVLGSIGVCCVYLDDKKALEMQGLKEIPFISNQSPNKNADPATPKGASALQLRLNHTADVFISAVARNRGITAEQVVASYGAGGVMVGTHAVAAGLADSLGSLESVLGEMTGTNYNNSTARASMPAPTTQSRGADVMELVDKNAKGATEDKTETTTAAAPKEATPAAPASSEPSAELKAAQEAANKTASDLVAANERIAALELKDRTGRFTAMSADFPGEQKAHLAMMEHLATTVGEDSPLFTGYVETQRASAEQITAGSLFTEVGRSGGAPAANSAEAQIEAKAKELMAKDSKLTMEQAVSQVADDNPELYRQHVAEQKAA